MSKKHFLSILCLVFLPIFLFSAWLNDYPSQITQPDGTVVEVLLSGDEFHNWAHDSDGYTIIQDPETGFWCWAIPDNGDIISSGYPIHLHTAQSRNISPRVNISRDLYNEKRSKMDVSKELWAQRSGDTEMPRTRSTGILNNIVIFIRFSDQTEYTKPSAHYDDMFNGQGVGLDSQYQYFKDASYNSFEVYSHLYPIASGSTVLSYQDINPRSYYMPYSTTNPNGYQENAMDNNPLSRTYRQHKLLERAIVAVRSQIPTSLNIDTNDDGAIDNIVFIVRGGVTAWSTLLWPHKWALYYQYYEEGYFVMINDKVVWEFNFLIEDHTEQSGVSVLAHELAHTINIPDLYRYDYSGAPIGFWCLMAQNTNPPQSISAYLKFAYTDWIASIPTISTEGTYTLYPLSTHQTQNAYRINTNQSTGEYFVVEYRNKNVSLIDSTIPGSGLLVYRAYPDAGWGNSSGPPDELYVHRQNGTATFDGLLNNAFFSLESGRTAINRHTNPYPFHIDGTVANLNISNIGSAGDSITFDLNIVQTSTDNPQNLVTTPGNSVVSLHWQPPVSTNNLYGYKIYRDKMLIAEAANENFEDTTAKNGDTYEYFVTALFSHYMPTESTPSNTSEVTLYIDPLRPATNLTNSIVENDILLNWETYTNYAGEFTHTLSNDISYSYEITVPRSYAYAHRWSPEQLIENNKAGNDLHQVQFRANSLNANYRLQIWTGGSDTPYDPGKLVLNQAISNVSLTGWTTVNINPPLSIPYNKELWISIYIVSPGDFSIPMDSGPQIEGYSNVLIHSSGATTVYINNGITNNWMIRGYASEPTNIPEPPTGFIGYNVYRDDVLLTNVPTLNLHFNDENVPNGIYDYKVVAVYETGEAIPANLKVNKGITSENPDTTLPITTELIANYPNPFNPETTILFAVQKSSHVNIEIYNIRGQKVKTLLNEIMESGKHEIHWNGTDDNGKNLASGVYLYQMKTDHYTSTKRMLLMK